MVVLGTNAGIIFQIEIMSLTNVIAIIMEHLGGAFVSVRTKNRNRKLNLTLRPAFYLAVLILNAAHAPPKPHVPQVFNTIQVLFVCGAMTTIFLRLNVVGSLQAPLQLSQIMPKASC
jgi:hypothetical protein